MNSTQGRTDHRSDGEREEVRVRRAILQFVTGHQYCELPTPVAMPEPVDTRPERRSERAHSVQR